MAQHDPFEDLLNVVVEDFLAQQDVTQVRDPRAEQQQMSEAENRLFNILEGADPTLGILTGIAGLRPDEVDIKLQILAGLTTGGALGSLLKAGARGMGRAAGGVARGTKDIISRLLRGIPENLAEGQTAKGIRKLEAILSRNLDDSRRLEIFTETARREADEAVELLADVRADRAAREGTRLVTDAEEALARREGQEFLAELARGGTERPRIGPRAAGARATRPTLDAAEAAHIRELEILEETIFRTGASGSRRARAILQDPLTSGPSAKGFFHVLDDTGRRLEGVVDAQLLATGFIDLGIPLGSQGFQEIGPRAVRQLGREIIESFEAAGHTVRGLSGLRIDVSGLGRFDQRQTFLPRRFFIPETRTLEAQIDALGINKRTLVDSGIGDTRIAAGVSVIDEELASLFSKRSQELLDATAAASGEVEETISSLQSIIEEILRKEGR